MQTCVKEFSRDLSDAELRDKLLSRISWDCGQSDFLEIQNELIRSLKNMGQGEFEFFPDKASMLADLISSRILKQSVNEDADSRMLTSADLRELIISATQVSISEVNFNRLLTAATNPQLILASDTHPPIAPNKWLYTGSDLSQKEGMIKRVEIERKLEYSLKAKGLAILTGSIGLGKSVTSRSFARSHSDEFYIVEFRDANSASIRHTLDKIVKNIACFRESILILENFNAIENQDLRLLIEYVIAEIQKSNIYVLITCHTRPSLTTLTNLGIDAQDVVQCQHFSLGEIKSLIQTYSGDAEGWGRPIYARSGTGHPVLAHALVTSLANRNWLENEKVSIFGSDFSAPDLESSLASTRRRIISELPVEERDLLYRLSLEPLAKPNSMNFYWA